MEGQIEMSSGIVYFPNPSATNTIVWLGPGANPQALLPTNQALAGTSLLRLPNETTGVLATRGWVTGQLSGGTTLNTTTQSNLGNSVYDIADNIDIVFATADTKNTSIRMPAAATVAEGRRITIKNATNAVPANQLLIITSGGTFDTGLTTRFFTQPLEVATYVWSGSFNRWLEI